VLGACLGCGGAAEIPCAALSATTADVTSAYPRGELATLMGRSSSLCTTQAKGTTVTAPSVGTGHYTAYDFSFVYMLDKRACVSQTPSKWGYYSHGQINHVRNPMSPVATHAYAMP
jgi:hypothetical protein